MNENNHKCDICLFSSSYHFGVKEPYIFLGKEYNIGDEIHLCSLHGYILYRDFYKINNEYLKWYHPAEVAP